MSPPDVKSSISAFVTGIEDLDFTLALSLNAFQDSADTAQKELDGLVDSALILSEKDGKRLFRFRQDGGNTQGDGVQDAIRFYGTFLAAKRKLERTKTSGSRLSRNLFLALMSTYDTYLASVITSLVAFRDGHGHAEEGEISVFLQTRPLDQFVWLEEKFGVNLGAAIAVPVIFLEALERRWLLIYNAGLVTEHYLSFCIRLGIPLQDIAAGQSLEITSQYCKTACDVMYATGVEMAHLLWREVIPEQTGKANAALQDLTFALIQQRRYDLARTLLAFANTTLRKYADESNRSVFLINGALAAYLAGDHEESTRMLSTVDWSATSEVLQLANLVLTRQHHEAAALMRKIGNSGRPSKAEYLRWPLFRDFRSTPDFFSAFSELFGEVTLAETDVRPPPQAATA